MTENNTKFSELFLTCDTREQSAIVVNKKQPSAIIKGKLLSEYTNDEIIYLSKKRPRIWGLASYFMKGGAEVIIDKLDKCDYKIEGMYQDKEVNLGIEYKTLEDMAGSIEDLEWKLPESYKLYEDVALCIEGRLNIIERGNFQYIRNWANEEASVLRYDLYTSRVQTWTNLSVQVRQFERDSMFPYVVEDLLNYIVKGTHTSFRYKETNNQDVIFKMLIQIPGVGLKTLNKFFTKYPKSSMKDIMAYSVDELKEYFGNDRGIKIYNVLNNVNYIESKTKKKKT
jgi:hypothetical protein